MDALSLVSSLVSSGAIRQNRAKDIKTALIKLADACGVDPEDLDLARLEDTYEDTLKTYFTTLGSSVSPYTVRNTLSNLRHLYRTAHDVSLLTNVIPAYRPWGRQVAAVLADMREQNPYLKSHTGKAAGFYGIKLAQWPPDIAKGWRDYAALKSIQVRPRSLRDYTNTMSQYMGYNMHYDGEPPTTFDELFEIPRLARWVAWHANRVSAVNISETGRNVVILCQDMGKHLERPDFAKVKKFLNQLPKPVKVHDKKAERHTVSLVELDQLGATLMAEARLVRPWAQIRPDRNNGAHRAVTFATGLSIRLLVRCPRRRREMIEMDLGGRLYKDAQGKWQLYYKSHQLKIAEHHGIPNEFRMEWPADIVADLDEYLSVYRPILLGKSTTSAVFINEHGKPLGEQGFRNRIVMECWGRLKKHVFPHLFRTLWCDAYLDAHPGDFEGAAAMLNDTPETVQGWYRQFRVEQQLAKGIHFNAQLFGNGHKKRR